LPEGSLIREIISRLMTTPSPTAEDVRRIKLEVCRLNSVSSMPSNVQIIEQLFPEERTKILPILKGKTVRSLSGVAVIAVMTEPRSCPKGRCAYCPGGPSEGVPQSYTGFEPAAMRGAQNSYDPYRQVKSRMAQLATIGHDVDKIDLIIMGGTFTAAPPSYQENFIKACLEAIAGCQAESLEGAMKASEGSPIRNVGITVETRPDWAQRENVDKMLGMGVTRVEVGVQNVYDDIYKIVERGHTVDDVIEATRVLKDSGLKVCYHMMPGLPGSSFDRDLKGFEAIFSDPRFKPDMLKIYPCLVLRGTKLHKWWLEGKYTPHDTDAAAALVAEVKKIVPPWVRIMRVQRDIPSHLIVDGVEKSNLRELALDRLRREGLRCRCIRCREVGHSWLRDGIQPDPNSVTMMKREYDASEGKEVFISVEDESRGVLVGLVRLRVPSPRVHRPELRGEVAIVRELHVYGPLVPVGMRRAEAWQHKGYGAMLLAEAERTSAEDFDARKILVLSALGTKRYYYRLGYKPDGPYVAKAME